MGFKVRAHDIKIGDSGVDQVDAGGSAYVDFTVTLPVVYGEAIVSVPAQGLVSAVYLSTDGSWTLQGVPGAIFGSYPLAAGTVVTTVTYVVAD